MRDVLNGQPLRARTGVPFRVHKSQLVTTNNPKGRPMKKLTRPVQKVNAPVLGLDIHKDLIAYCLLDRGGNDVEA